ncbi:MAG: acyl-ACP--UDP-N-acetylglucosamine O-acyltransferase [Herbaspirillum sp.]
MSRIHPSAIIAPDAQLDASVEVGAYSVIGENVRIGAGTRVGPHVVIDGHTTIGCDNRIFSFASLGSAPQDKKYAGEPTRLEIGDRNTIREFVTFNLGTAQDAGLTRIGSDNWIMAYVHLAHDCQLGNNIILANNATLGGHVHLSDWVFLGGFTSVHQFCHIGAHAMTAFTAAVSQDVPPFVTAAGNRAAPAGINSEGLKRRGFMPEQVAAIKHAYKLIYRSGLSLEAARQELLRQEEQSPESAAHIRLMREFITSSSRGIIR